MVTLTSICVPPASQSTTALSPPHLHQHLSSPLPCAQSITAPVKRSAPFELLPTATPKKAAIDLAQSVPTDIGEFIDRDVKLLQQLGWRGLVTHRRPRGDFTSLNNVLHPAHRLPSSSPRHHGLVTKFSAPSTGARTNLAMTTWTSFMKNSLT